jgi:hypothetical protein
MLLRTAENYFVEPEAIRIFPFHFSPTPPSVGPSNDGAPAGGQIGAKSAANHSSRPKLGYNNTAVAEHHME